MPIMNGEAQYTYRQGTIQDVSALVPLINASYAEAAWNGGDGEYTDETRTSTSDLTKIMENPDTFVLVMETDSGSGSEKAIVGCVELAFKGEEMKLTMLSVSLKLQGGGLGKKLANAAFAEGKKHGCKKCIIEVVSFKDALRQWYERLGFKINGETCIMPVPGRNNEIMSWTMDRMSTISKSKIMPKAIWNNVVIAETDKFETVEGNIYFPPDSVKKEYLKPTSTHTVCGWKGTASYYTVSVNGKDAVDGAWYYPTPKKEAENITGYLAFWKGVQVQK
ncbi:hypothetical protein SmJEL517_g01528 [Synchytrium microbalum]|uniref:N-acetyltransferase domain-containing protein n=1 Tax=Synchytrium microbalum TaxID=1806994 RepID=A0A507CF41_9FUNG|nr:uncharacterized protein SmJEL517_g01528 [Synchytrium microbalum]TPX36205.1 hypothetical protein SmJEL517_g01528 [Synchytrium microbalum]